MLHSAVVAGWTRSCRARIVRRRTDAQFQEVEGDEVSIDPCLAAVAPMGAEGSPNPEGGGQLKRPNLLVALVRSLAVFAAGRRRAQALVPRLRPSQPRGWPTI